MPDEEVYRRAETGTMQFEDDWPGVFIRGDNAAVYAMYLTSLMRILETQNRGVHLGEEPVDVFALMNVNGLIDLLRASDTRSDPNPQKAILAPLVPQK